MQEIEYEYPKPAPRAKKEFKPLRRNAIKIKAQPVNPDWKQSGNFYVLKRGTPIRKVSAKQAKIETEKSKVYRLRSEGERPFCRGCGRFDVPLSNSHRIGQANKEHVANPYNLDTYCIDGGGCHSHYESGRLYLLDNGNDVLEWLAETDFERYRMKCYKMLDRINDDNLSLENLPTWVEQHINSL